MDGTELQQTDELGVGHLAQEMHAGPVALRDAGPHFGGKNVFPTAQATVTLRVGPCAVAHIVGPHQQHTRVGPTRQQLGQGAHEGVVTPVRLQVAVDEGNDLAAAVERGGGPSTVAQGELHLWVGRDGGGVNAVVDDRDAAAERLRKSAGLPLRRADARIGHLKMQQVVEVLQAQAASVAAGVGSGKLGVKAHVGTVRLVVELAVDGQPRLRPDFLQKQALAPAVVRHDHIGHHPLGLECQRGPKTSLTPNGLGFKVAHPRVNIGGAAPAGAVRHEHHALPVGHVHRLHRHGPHTVALAHQRRCQMLELPRKILVNKQDIGQLRHRPPTRQRAAPCRPVCLAKSRDFSLKWGPLGTRRVWVQVVVGLQTQRAMLTARPSARLAQKPPRQPAGHATQHQGQRPCVSIHLQPPCRVEPLQLTGAT